jgi:hypothetical protein
MVSALMFDPGVRTGIVHGWWDDRQPLQVLDWWQFDGGTEGLDIWLDSHWTLIQGVDHIGSEKFIPRTLPGMSHTLESTYPLVQEGLLIGRQVMPHYPQGNWQPATCQYPTRTHERMDDLLKTRGLWFTGSDVGMDDADDVLSATRHMVYFVTRTLRHEPTISWFYGGEE